MKTSLKILTSSLTAFGFFSFKVLFPISTFAHCPLCVAGAAVGLSLSRWIGVDDSITGVWLAALLGAISFWSYGYLVRKIKIGHSFLLKPLLYIVFFAATIWSFYYFNLVVRMGTLFGIDKLIFGMVAGGVVFYLTDIANELIYKIVGKSLFRYQRIILSLGMMIVMSLTIYILISYFI